MAIQAPDLTQRPPRSPRVRIGGYAILARILDKGRAAIVGKNGEYNYACPLDMQFMDFVGVDQKALKKEIAKGKSDSELLAWINSHAKTPRTGPEIAAWSQWQDQRAPGNTEMRAYFNESHEKYAPKREDIVTWFDLLDLDDYVSFGGQP